MMVGRGPVNHGFKRCGLALAVLVSLAAWPARAEDGYALWLRYAPLEGEALQALEGFNPRVRVDAATGDTATLEVAVDELHRGLTGLLGHAPESAGGAGGIIELSCDAAAEGAAGGFSIRHSNEQEQPTITIEAADQVGCLYGSFALLRELSLGKDPNAIAVDEQPAMPLRLLNHWDNPDGTVERGLFK